jgi:hypothetical protein
MTPVAIPVSFHAKRGETISMPAWLPDAAGNRGLFTFGYQFRWDTGSDSLPTPGRPSAMIIEISRITAVTSLIGFIIGLPTVIATYYQSFKARKEAQEARDGLHSANCLEFVSESGDTVNLVALETLHTLPKPGDIVLLPGDGVGADSRYIPGAYRIERIEHIYTPVTLKTMRPREARLTKAVALVCPLN